MILQCKQLNDEKNKIQSEIDAKNDMLNGTMGQVVALSQELTDNRDLLVHSELDTSYYKKIAEQYFQKFKNWNKKYVI